MMFNILLLTFFIQCTKTKIDIPHNVIAQNVFMELAYKDINNTTQFNETNNLRTDVDARNINTAQNSKTNDLYENINPNIQENVKFEENNAIERLKDVDPIRGVREELKLPNVNIQENVDIKDFKAIEKLKDVNPTKNINPEQLKLPKQNKTPKEIKDQKTIDNATKIDINKIGTEVNNDDDSVNCIGQEEYCNMTKEEYYLMMENYIYPQPYEWVLIGTHTIVFVVGLVGNALVCTAVYRNYSMRTVTNYFIVNLAVADFMVILICLPPTVIWDVTETWFFGEGLCKVMLFFQSVSVTVSVLTLTFISVDRWYAICFPLKFKSTTGRAKTAIFIIWIMSLIFNSPELVVLTTVKTVPLRFNLHYLVQCMATWSETSDLVWHIIKVLFIYTLPLILMTVAYCQIVRVLWTSKRIPGRAEDAQWSSAEQSQLRSRRKAAKMLVAVVVMFAVCYFPVHLLSVLRYALVMEQNDAITCLALISHVLCYANSAINPVIYNFMSGKFRNEFRRTFCCTPRPLPEQFTTLTRVSSKHYTSRKYDMTLHDVKGHANCRHVCTTTFIENGTNGTINVACPRLNSRNNNSFKNYS